MTFGGDPYLNAESIIKEGRWDTLMRALLSLAKKAPDEDSWKFVVLAQLSNHLFLNYNEFKRMVEAENPDIPMMSWRARNLTELYIWCAYCTKDQDNMKRFYDDAGRDVVNLVSRSEKWAVESEMDESLVAPFIETRRKASENLTATGRDGIDEKFLEVRKAAEAVDPKLALSFGISNKILSKFAHPTAMCILLPMNEMEKLRESLKLKGAQYFWSAFEVLENHVAELTAKYATK